MDWRQAKDRASKVAKDGKLTEKLVEEAFEKSQKNPGFLKKARRDLRLLLRMVKAQATGKYKLPWRSMVLAVAAVLYFVNPIDVIPDFILGTGLIDDAGVLVLVFKSLKSDLEAYAAWEEERRINNEKRPLPEERP